MAVELQDGCFIKRALVDTDVIKRATETIHGAGGGEVLGDADAVEFGDAIEKGTGTGVAQGAIDEEGGGVFF